MNDESHRETGEKLAQRALDGARRQLKNEHLVAILYDWGKLALEAGDREQAEQRWSELLDLVTNRPEPSTKPNVRKTSWKTPPTRRHLVVARWLATPLEISVAGFRKNSADPQFTEFLQFALPPEKCSACHPERSEGSPRQLAAGRHNGDPSVAKAPSG